MRHFSKIGLVALVSALGFLNVQPAAAEDLEIIHGSGATEPLSSVFEVVLENYASTQGLGIEQVQNQFKKQPEFDSLLEEIQSLEGENFAAAEYLGGDVTARMYFIHSVSSQTKSLLGLSSLDTQVVVRGGLSNSALESARTAINVYLASLQASFTAGFDPISGRVEIWGFQKEQFANLLETLQANFPDITFNPELFSPEVEDTQALTANSGGLDIGCSAGYFGAVNSSTVGVLTAAHCQGAALYLGGLYYTATNEYLAPSSEGDIGWYRLGSMQTGVPLSRSDLSEQVITGTTTKATITDLMSPSAATPYIGQLVCIHGVVTARACGAISAVEYTTTYTTKLGKFTYSRMVVLNGSLTKDGDSGAAAFSEIDTTHVKAVGIVSGISLNGPARTFLTRIGAAIYILNGSQYLGVYAVLTGS